MAFDECVDAKARDRLAVAVEKHALLRIALKRHSMQLIDRYWPQRTHSPLIAFANNLHRLDMPVNILDSKVSSFTGTGAGIVEKKQQCVVALPLRRAAIRRVQNRVHLRLVQVGNARMGRPLKWYQANL